MTSGLRWTNGSIMEKSLREKITHEQSFILKPPNERDLNNEKLISRYLVAQTSCNPFHANNNYLKDLEVQDNFLIPKNSSMSE
tara:strand:- start:1059 stop:1307 length:249 start_codon:yes stop_codon:yes gene_type:complete